MKRKLWQRRLLCCFLAVAVLLGGLLCCLPVRAGAVVPLGLVQSALASYVTSAGYKMWSENGGGELMVKALSTLYQSWLDSTDPVGALTLGQMSENDYVYLDTSGQIVIRKAAADMFQQFADWIQSEYSVPVGSDTPTSVVAPSGGGGSVNSGSLSSALSYPFSFVIASSVTGNYNADSRVWLYVSSSPVHVAYFTMANSRVEAVFASEVPFTFNTYGYLPDNPPSNPTPVVNASSVSYGGKSFYVNTFSSYDLSVNLPENSKLVSSFNGQQINGIGYEMLYGNVSYSPGISGLGVTLAQAVADVVGRAKDDDAVVIGVGAGVGATAQDIADMVAQGVKAQTLDPSVSITAEAVIDTPVQPYPDIDGLGLPTLGAALVSRFPFCVPWDFVDTLKILNADPIPPVFDVTLVPASVAARWGVSGNYTIHVDLTSQEYAKLFVALRWGTLVGFCLGLALLTKRLIWTA